MWKQICSTKGKYGDRGNGRSAIKTMFIIYLYDRTKFRGEKKKHYITEALYCLALDSCLKKHLGLPIMD